MAVKVCSSVALLRDCGKQQNMRLINGVALRSKVLHPNYRYDDVFGLIELYLSRLYMIEFDDRPSSLCSSLTSMSPHCKSATNAICTNSDHKHNCNHIRNHTCSPRTPAVENKIGALTDQDVLLHEKFVSTLRQEHDLPERVGLLVLDPLRHVIPCEIITRNRSDENLILIQGQFDRLNGVVNRGWIDVSSPHLLSSCCLTNRWQGQLLQKRSIVSAASAASAASATLVAAAQRAQRAQHAQRTQRAQQLRLRRRQVNELSRRHSTPEKRSKCLVLDHFEGYETLLHEAKRGYGLHIQFDRNYCCVNGYFSEIGIFGVHKRLLKRLNQTQSRKTDHKDERDGILGGKKFKKKCGTSLVELMKCETEFLGMDAFVKGLNRKAQSLHSDLYGVKKRRKDGRTEKRKYRESDYFRICCINKGYGSFVLGGLEQKKNGKEGGDIFGLEEMFLGDGRDVKKLSRRRSSIADHYAWKRKCGDSRVASEVDVRLSLEWMEGEGGLIRFGVDPLKKERGNEDETFAEIKFGGKANDEFEYVLFMEYGVCECFHWHLKSGKRVGFEIV